MFCKVIVGLSQCGCKPGVLICKKKTAKGCLLHTGICAKSSAEMEENMKNGIIARVGVAVAAVS